MSHSELDRLALYFKAISSSIRISIICALQDGEKCVSDIVKETGEQQAHVSQQLGILFRNKVVVRRKYKTTVFYSLQNNNVLHLIALIRELIGSTTPPPYVSVTTEMKLDSADHLVESA